MLVSPDPVTTSLDELVLLGANDTALFAKTFFPETIRQEYAPFHYDVFDLFDDNRFRYIALKMFRGSAKTTIVRIVLAKRIAYSITRVAMIVSASQYHSILGLTWLKNKVERNQLFRDTFQLEKGSKWAEDHIEIFNRSTGVSTTVLAAGITGQTRGFNVDDYRPDFISVDDPLNEENTATPVQREKIITYFFGSLKQSLVPESENPASKLALQQTPFVKDDLIDMCCKDPTFASREYSCYTQIGESAWPARWSTSTLVADEQASIINGTHNTWSREMRVSVKNPESCDFKEEWLQYWTAIQEPERLVTAIYIDPTPPPSETQLANNFQDKDFEAIAVAGLHEGKFFILEVVSNRGHDPSWTIRKVFELCEKWRPIRVAVEGVNYQKTLKWLLEQEVAKRRLSIPIFQRTSKRSKRHRIVQSLQGIATQGNLFFHPTQRTLVEQFTSYPTVSHDDELDAVAGAVEELQNYQLATLYNPDAPKPYESLDQREREYHLEYEGMSAP